MSVNSVRFSHGLKVVQLLAPQDITETATGSSFVNVKKAHWVTFLVQFGVITGDSIDVTVEVAPVNTDTGTETACAFRYIKTGAIDTNTYGTVTAVAAGSTVGMVAASDDNKTLIIDVDVADMQSALATAKYCRVLITPATTSVSACLVNAIAILEPVYPTSTHISDS